MTGPSADAAALERRLFEVLGGWVPAVAEPEVKLLLRSHSFQHAWHAELWESLGGAAWGREPDLGEVWPMVEDLPAVDAGTAERLSAVYRGVLPALVDAYRAVLGRSSPLTDGALVRSVRLMVADDEDALERAQPLLAAISGMREAAEDARM